MKIGIFSAAAPVSKENLSKALTHLESLGHTYSLPIDASKEYGTGKFLFSSASVADRLASFSQLLNDDSVDAILCVRGAYGCGELLSVIPWELVESKAKPIIGMSDITSLLWAVYSKTSCAAIHGPVLVSGFLDLQSASQTTSREWLFNSLGPTAQLAVDFTLNPLRGQVGDLNGKTLAGNLTVFTSLVGTPFSPRFSGHIVILEETGEPLYKVHRLLTQLRDAGCFEGCLGVVLGYFTKCENAKQQPEPTLQTVFLDIFRGVHELPIWEGFPLGHEPLNFSIRFGQQLTITSDGKVVLG